MEENKSNEFEMNSNVNQTSTTTNKQKKSKIIPTLVLIIVILILLLVLCVGNMYALTKDYDNIFLLITSMLSGKEVVGDGNNIEQKEENSLDASEETNTDLGKNDSNSSDGINEFMIDEYKIINDSNEEKNGVTISKTNGKLYLTVVSNELNSCGEPRNVELNKNYEISNINVSNIKSIYISDYEQDGSVNYAFFLMNDGTVEWLDLADALANKNFVAEGKLENVTNVVRIATVEFIHYINMIDIGGGLSIFGIKQNGESYDLIDKCMNTNYNDSHRENLVISTDNNKEKNGVTISKTNGKLYLTVVSNELNSCGEPRNVELNKNYEISNINVSNIKSIYISDYEQDGSVNYAFFLMNDGTVEWLDLADALANKNFVAEGKLENVTDVVRIATVEFMYNDDNPNAGKVLSIFGIKEDGNFYDLIKRTLNFSNKAK